MAIEIYFTLGGTDLATKPTIQRDVDIAKLQMQGWASGSLAIV
jgi:hypothetical protein